MGLEGSLRGCSVAFRRDHNIKKYKGSWIFFPQLTFSLDQLISFTTFVNQSIILPVSPIDLPRSFNISSVSESLPSLCRSSRRTFRVRFGTTGNRFM